MENHGKNLWPIVSEINGVVPTTDEIALEPKKYCRNVRDISIRKDTGKYYKLSLGKT